MDAYCAFCVSDSLLNPFLVSSIRVLKSFILPSESVIDIPNLFIALATASVGADILDIHDLSEVPALEALIPLLAIRPRAVDTS